MVYTRVYFFLIGSRGILGNSTPREEELRLRRMTLDDFVLDLWRCEVLVLGKWRGIMFYNFYYFCSIVCFTF